MEINSIGRPLFFISVSESEQKYFREHCCIAVIADSYVLEALINAVKVFSVKRCQNCRQIDVQSQCPFKDMEHDIRVLSDLLMYCNALFLLLYIKTFLGLMLVCSR